MQINDGGLPLAVVDVSGGGALARQVPGFSWAVGPPLRRRRTGFGVSPQDEGRSPWGDGRGRLRPREGSRRGGFPPFGGVKTLYKRQLILRACYAVERRA